MLEAGSGRANDVGEPSHRVGEDQERNRIRRGAEDVANGFERAAWPERPAQTRRDQSKCKDEPRHRERQHDERVENAASAHRAAHKKSRDKESDDDVDNRRNTREDDRVAHRARCERMRNRLDEVVKRPTLGKDRSVPLAVRGKRVTDDANVRQHRNERDHCEEARRDDSRVSCERLEPRAGARLCEHRVTLATEDQSADGVRKNGCSEHHGRQRVRLARRFHFLDAVEDLNRRRLRELEHQRRAEFGETPHKDDCSAGEEPRTDERQRHAEETFHAAGAEIRRGLFHRRVEIRDRRNEVEIENWEERDRFEKHDQKEAAGVQKVDRRRDDVKVEKQRVDRAFAPKQLFHPDRANEGRQDQRREDQGREQGLPWKRRARREHRQWQRDRDGDNRRTARDQERVAESFTQHWIAEDVQHVKERERAVVRNECARHPEPNRVDERYSDDHEERREPDALRHGPHGPRMVMESRSRSALINPKLAP